MAQHRKRTPLSVAKSLRIALDGMIAKTWDDYHAERNGGTFLNGYQFAKLVQEQVDCSFRAATVAMGRVVPELFADYWATLPLTKG